MIQWKLEFLNFDIDTVINTCRYLNRLSAFKLEISMAKLRNSGGDVVHQVKRQWRCRPNGIMVRRRGEGEEVMTTMGM